MDWALPRIRLSKLLEERGTRSLFLRQKIATKMESITIEGIPATDARFQLETVDFHEADDTFVSLEVSARGAFGSPAAFLFCYLNDVFLGFAFAKGGTDCDEQVVTFDIPISAWSAAATDGSRMVEVWASPASLPENCSTNRVFARVSHQGVITDCNDNGAWDA